LIFENLPLKKKRLILKNARGGEGGEQRTKIIDHFIESFWNRRRRL
jgi:hypothetical protein